MSVSVVSRIRRRHQKIRVWRLPTLIVLAAMFFSWWNAYLDRELSADGAYTALAPHLRFDVGAVASLLSAVSSGMIAFTGFVFTIVLLSVQFGTSAFSPRLIPLFLRDRVVRAALGIFMATFIYSLLVALRLGTRTSNYEPLLSTLFAVGLSMVSVLFFFLLIGRVVDLLRVVRLLTRVANASARRIDQTHPRPHDGSEAPPCVMPEDDDSLHYELHSGRSGVLLGVDLQRLAQIAEKADVCLELVHSPGDYVPSGSTLCRIYGKGTVSRRAFQRQFAFGDERDLADDPAFGFRVLVDVAIKALSPAINDPTTAIQALDRIEDLLVRLVRRDLGAGSIRGRDGTLRLVYLTPGWADYLALATDEVRHYGADSIQVVRRLRALLQRLLGVCPPDRAGPISERLIALDATALRFDQPLDRALALMPDPQGIGGAVSPRRFTRTA